MYLCILRKDRDIFLSDITSYREEGNFKDTFKLKKFWFKFKVNALGLFSHIFRKGPGIHFIWTENIKEILKI